MYIYSLKTLVYKIVFDVAVYTIVLVLLLCVSGVDSSNFSQEQIELPCDATLKTSKHVGAYY